MGLEGKSDRLGGMQMNERLGMTRMQLRTCKEEGVG